MMGKMLSLGHFRASIEGVETTPQMDAT